MTTDLPQAQKWRRAPRRPNITEFVVPNADLDKLNIKVFDSANSEWEQFVTRGRQGTLLHDYDAVSGPMLANPQEVTEQGASPESTGCQLAIFSKKGAAVFNRHMKGNC